MLDYNDEDVVVFDFDELADHLMEQGQDASPSTLHGCLSGVLAAGAPAQAEAGLALLSQALDVDFHGELAAQIMQLYTVTAAAFVDDEFDFHPLLPDDDEDIALRTASLAAWAGGFLSGFAQVNREQVDADSSEILRDFAAIAEADVDAEADEDESEASYLEVTEYLRFAALNVFMDSRSTAPGNEPPSVH